jgi:HD-GYP domain-containing protein (c-di-GMP phosphodiesterase class II)
VAAVEIQDPCTHGHHRRVTLYAQAILQSLDPGGTRLSRLSLALGTEHLDIGKVGIPEHILLKPDSLSPDETPYLAEHPEVGRRILQPILGDEVALEVVTWHHERWDGTGYPHGLAGEKIPLSARIAGVADVLDALTSCRPHREALDWEEAAERIREESGKGFDPRVVEAFVEALPRLREIWEELGEREPRGLP